ncbi:MULTISPECIES: hypothetical protein [unclassified Streptomyces]|uniref:hypothetical protein n=1 Tax=Streptomycetaceae TaxID=2062 RepID=UPI002E7A1BFA|nr:MULTISPECIES: hypothetical protein [unclassified Streptomyces]MED7953702.1 hypothetical protein [Streptomyces sp. BE303]MEE1821352.1 hypothetical protein [Streptomyces sp. BE20]
MSNARHLGYRDELLADGQLHRRYEDGRSEWRRRGAGHLVHWQDSLGRSGTDERLGRDLVKRLHTDGTTEYGRDIGYGRTVWAGGHVTVNRTSFSGRLGVVVGALGVAGAAAITAAQLPPETLSEAEEEALRQAAQRQQTSDGGGGGGSDGGGSDTGSDAGWDDTDNGWDDSGDDWDGDDFG